MKYSKDPGVDVLRGHPVELAGGEWRYVDTGEPTAGNRRPCGHCDLPDAPEGHDGCLGTLPGVMNACCGHGRVEEAYVQFWNGSHIAGIEAAGYQRKSIARKHG